MKLKHEKMAPFCACECLGTFANHKQKRNQDKSWDAKDGNLDAVMLIIVLIDFNM